MIKRAAEIYMMYGLKKTPGLCTISQYAAAVRRQWPVFVE
jgi:hypothetical protein